MANGKKKGTSRVTEVAAMANRKKLTADDSLRKGGGSQGLKPEDPKKNYVCTRNVEYPRPKRSHGDGPWTYLLDKIKETRGRRIYF